MPLSLQHNPYQRAFLAALAARTPAGARSYDRLLLMAGRRGGKTLIGAVAAVTEAAKPGTIGWVCAPSYPQLHDYVIPAISALLPPAALIRPFSEKHYEWQLRNGSLIQARSLDDPERGRGPGLHWLWIDETCQVQEKAWQVLSPTLIEQKGVAWFTSTPQGYDWVYNAFWLPAQQAVPGYWAVRYHTRDNPTITEEEVERRRQELSPEMFRQEMEASFEHFTGAVYEGFGEQHLIGELPAFDHEYPVLVGLDPGADHPFAAVVLRVAPTGLYVVGEYLERHLPVAVHVAALRALVRSVAANALDVRWCIDRSALQVQIELAQFGLMAQATPKLAGESGMGDVTAGIMRVQEWMRAGQFFVHRRCQRTIEQLRTYRWEESLKKDGTYGRERPRKQNDDLADALRYAIMTWPRRPEVVVRETDRFADAPDSIKWAILRDRACSKGLPPANGLGDFYMN